MVPNMSFCRLAPDGSWPPLKNPDPPLKLLLLLFWITFDVVPLRPVRKGKLLLLIMPLLPLLTGRTAPLGLAKGT